MNGTTNTAEDRKLLAEVSKWARAYGWVVLRDTGWQNPSRIIQVDWDERGVWIARRNGTDRMWPAAQLYPATSVRQAVDMLAAIGILPPRFSSAYKAGWHDGYFHTVEDETATEIRASWAGAR